MQALEHTAIFHIMTVQNTFSVRKILTIVLIKKNAPGYMLRLFKGMLQIVFIISSLYNRIINLGVRDPDPGNDLRVYFL